MALLDYTQYKLLRSHSDKLEKVENVMRGSAPDRWSITFELKMLRDKLERDAYISDEDVIELFGSIMRHSGQLGPNAQELLQENLTPIVEDLRISEAVNRAAEAPRALTGRGQRR